MAVWKSRCLRILARLVELTGMVPALARQNGKKYGAAVLAGRIHRLHVRVEDAGSSADSATGQQQAALEELHDAAFLAPKYLMQTPGQEYVESVHRAKKELGDR